MNALAIKATEIDSARRQLLDKIDDWRDDHGNWRPDIPADVLTGFQQAEAHIQRLETDLKSLTSLENLREGQEEALTASRKTVNRVLIDLPTGDPSESAKSWGDDPPTFQPSRSGKSRVFGTASDARGFVKWFQAAVLHDPRAIPYLKQHNIPLLTLDRSGAVKAFDLSENAGSIIMALKAQNEGVLSAGGALVPEQYADFVITLLEVYGVFRRNARTWPMTAEIAHVPRLTGPPTTYWVAEGAPITESQATFDRVQLTAKKLGCLIPFTSELNEDSLIPVADYLAELIAWGFSRTEDLAGFLGDGSPAYGGITGLVPKILGLDAVPANIAGLVVASSPMVISDFTKLVGLLPQYAAERASDCKWYMSRGFYYSVALDLALKAGGVTEAEIVRGQVEPRFLGYGVELTAALSRTAAPGTIVALFGNLRLASLFGDRRQLSLMTSAHLYFAEDMLALRGTERFDIQNHSVGNASATASLRVPGPIVALQAA